MCITPTVGIGYRWELPHRLSIGFCLDPGVKFTATETKYKEKIGFVFLGMADFGFAFQKDND